MTFRQGQQVLFVVYSITFQTPSPFLVISAVKISTNSSSFFRTLHHFLPPCLLLIINSCPAWTQIHPQANLRHHPTPPSFLRPSSTNESFSWAGINLYLFSRLKMLGSGYLPVLLVPGAYASDRSAPAPGSKRNGKNSFPASSSILANLTLNTHSTHYCTLL